MPIGIYKRTKETKRKLSENRKGMKGRHHSEETKQKISEALKGKSHSEETCRKISEALNGRKLSEEHCKKISEAAKGRKYSEQFGRKISERQIGRKFSKETCKKISEGNKGKIISEETKLKSAISHIKCRTDGYCDIWSDWEYKKDCRKDFCEKCGVKEEIKIRKDSKKYTNMHLHHLDFDKKNCHPDNLQTLCNSCHTIIHNKRDPKKKKNVKLIFIEKRVE